MIPVIVYSVNTGTHASSKLRPFGKTFLECEYVISLSPEGLLP